jgi:hypothetical protein
MQQQQHRRRQQKQTQSKLKDNANGINDQKNVRTTLENSLHESTCVSANPTAPRISTKFSNRSGYGKSSGAYLELTGFKSHQIHAFSRPFYQGVFVPCGGGVQKRAGSNSGRM